MFSCASQKGTQPRILTLDVAAAELDYSVSLTQLTQQDGCYDYFMIEEQPPRDKLLSTHRHYYPIKLDWIGLTMSGKVEVEG